MIDSPETIKSNILNLPHTEGSPVTGPERYWAMRKNR